MHTKKYFCPFCKSEFYILPEVCSQCKREIPSKLVSKIVFVAALQKNMEQSKLEGIIDDDLFTNIINACSAKEKVLQNQLQEWVESKEQNLEKAETEAKLSVAPANLSIPEEESPSFIENETQEDAKALETLSTVEFSPPSKEETVQIQEETKVAEPLLTFSPSQTAKEKETETEPQKVKDDLVVFDTPEITKEKTEIKVEPLVTFTTPKKAELPQTTKKESEVQKPSAKPASTEFSKEELLDIRNIIRDQPQKVPKVVPGKPVTPQLSPQRKQASQKKQTKQMPIVAKKLTRALPAFRKPEPKERKPSVIIKYLLHPAVKENILLFIGIFLIMVGEVFVVSNSWSGFSDTMQFLSIYGLIFSSTILFSFVGSFVARRLEVHSGGKILFFITMMLMPLTFIPLANLNFLLASIIVPITLIIYGFIGRNIGRFFHETLPKFIYIYFLPLCLVHLAIPIIKEHHWLWFFACYGTAIFVILGLRKFIFSNRQEDTSVNPITPSTILLWSGILGIAWAEFALHTHYALITQKYILTVSQYAPILAMIAVVLARIDRLILKSTDPTSLVSIAAISTVVLAITVSTGNPYMILLTAIISMAFFIGYTQRFRRYYFFIASLILSVAVYFLLPLPIKQTLAELRSQLKSQLGYTQGRLPFSFYGITFLPYMIILCWLGHFIKRWEPKLMRYLQAWFVMLSIGLLILVKFGGTDVRAPLATLPLYGIGYLFAVMILEMPFLYYLGFASLSIWVYDLTVFMALPPEQRMLAVVGMAVFWYGLALIKFVRENIQKVLIDVSFACTITVIVLGGVFLKFPPVPLYSITLLLASLILILAVFVYSARWVWIPSFLTVWASISLLCYYDSSQNLHIAILYASAIWSYGSVLIALVVPYLQRKNLAFWLPTRSNNPTLNDKSLLQPLLFLLPLPIIAVCLCALNLWKTPGYDILYLLLAVSFLPLLMPKMLGIHTEFSKLALFPFFMAVLHNLNCAHTLISWPTLALAILFTMIAFLLYLRVEMIFGLFGVFLTLQSIFIYNHIAIPNQCTIIATLGILLFICQKFTKRSVRERFTSIFETYSIVYGGYALLLWIMQAFPNKIMDIPYLPVSILCGALAFLHFTFRRKEIFITVAFICWSATISLITKFLFPLHLQMHALSFALWGSILWSLHFFIQGYWQNKQFPRRLLYTYPTFAFAIAYTLATYFSMGQETSDIVSIITLLLCSLYCFVSVFEWQYPSFVYIAVAILNQSLMSLYLLVRTMKHLNEWPLAEAMICLFLLFLGAILEKKSKLVEANRAMYHFIVLMVSCTFAYVALWRLGFVFISSMEPIFTTHMIVCLLSALIFCLCYYKLKWQALPYPMFTAIWLSIVYILDVYGAIPVHYFLCTAVISLGYAFSHVLLPSLRPTALYSSIAFAFSSIAPLPYFYFYAGNSLDHYIAVIVLIIATVHALYCFLVTRLSLWSYLGLTYIVVAFSPFWLVKVLQISIFYQPLYLMILVALFLVLAWFCKNYDYKTTLNDVPHHWNGIAFSQVLRNISGILLSGWLLAATYIWFVTHIPSLQKSPNAHLFISEYNGVLQLSLLIGLGLAFILSFMQKGHLRNWHESTAVLNGALLLFIHTPFSQIFGQSASIYFANLDWAIYALVCVFLGLYLKRESLSFWGIVFGLLSLVGVPFSYNELSSVCAVLMLAFDLLIVSFTHPRWKSTPLYYGMFTFGLGLLLFYFIQNGQVSTSLEIAPIAGSLLALLFSFISSKANSWRIGFYQELARFVSWISLALGWSLGYLTTAPAPLQHLVILLMCIIVQVPVLAYIGKFETRRISHYFMLFMGVAFYLVLRTRTPILNLVAGYDHATFVLLFAILPSIAALWLRQKNDQILTSNFSLLCLGIAFLSQLTHFHALYYVATYFALVAVLITIRESYVPTNKFPENQLPQKETKISITPWFTLASIIFSFYLYAQEGPNSHQIIALNTALISIFGFLYFARYSDSISLYVGYIFLTMSGYFLFVLDYFRLGWHPLYLILAVNVVLLSGLSSRNYVFGNFMLPFALIRRIATSFAIFILGLILLIGALCSLQLVANINRDYISTIVGQDMLIIIVTGIATVLTSIHITRYDKEATTDLLLPAAIFFTAGLTAPIGHIINGVEWTIYCPPSIEWALLGLGLCIYNKHAQIKSYTTASFLSMSFALLSTGYDIQQPFTFITMFLTSLNLLCFYPEAKNMRHRNYYYHLYTANLLLAVYFMTFYLLPKTGKPVSLVFPLLATVTSVLAMLFIVIGNILERKYNQLKEWSLKDSITQTNIFFSAIATAFLGAAILLITRTTPNVTIASYDTHVALCIFSILLLIVESLLLAQRTGKEYYYYQFQLLIIGAFYLIRYKASWLDFLATYEPHVLIIFAISFFQIGSIFKEKKDKIAATFFHMAYALPMITLFYKPWELEMAGSSLFILGTTHFGLIYLMRQIRIALYTSLALLDLALYQIWGSMNIVDPQFYGIPLGITLIILAELTRNEIHKDRLSLLRTIGLLCIYGSSAMQVLMQFNQPVYALCLGILAFIGIIIGLFLKNNLYILISASFLVADVLLYIIKFGMEKGILPGMLLVLAGSAILGTYIYFQRQAMKKSQ